MYIKISIGVSFISFFFLSLSDYRDGLYSMLLCLVSSVDKNNNSNQIVLILFFHILDTQHCHLWHFISSFLFFVLILIYLFNINLCLYIYLLNNFSSYYIDLSSLIASMRRFDNIVSTLKLTPTHVNNRLRIISNISKILLRFGDIT